MSDIRETKQNTVTTLGNATEVVSRVIINIAGNDISNRLSAVGNITLDAIRDLAVARFNLELNRKQK